MFSAAFGRPFSYGSSVHPYLRGSVLQRLHSAGRGNNFEWRQTILASTYGLVHSLRFFCVEALIFYFPSGAPCRAEFVCVLFVYLQVRYKSVSCRRLVFLALVRRRLEWSALQPMNGYVIMKEIVNPTILWFGRAEKRTPILFRMMQIASRLQGNFFLQVREIPVFKSEDKVTFVVVTELHERLVGIKPVCGNDDGQTGKKDSHLSD